MKAPDVDVILHDGSSVPLRELYRERPLALLFVRHFGCTFCREQVAQFRDRPDLNLAFVTMGDPASAEAFRRKMRSPHRFVCDPERELYRQFDLRRGRMWQMVNPNVVARGMQATLAGHGMARPIGDPLQLGGTFVVDRGGRVAWEHRNRDAADHPSLGALERALASAAEASAV